MTTFLSQLFLAAALLRVSMAAPPHSKCAAARPSSPVIISSAGSSSSSPALLLASADTAPFRDEDFLILEEAPLQEKTGWMRRVWTGKNSATIMGREEAAANSSGWRSALGSILSNKRVPPLTVLFFASAFFVKAATDWAVNHLPDSWGATSTKKEAMTTLPMERTVSVPGEGAAVSEPVSESNNEAHNVKEDWKTQYEEMVKASMSLQDQLQATQAEVEGLKENLRYYESLEQKHEIALQQALEQERSQARDQLRRVQQAMVSVMEQERADLIKEFQREAASLRDRLLDETAS